MERNDKNKYGFLYLCICGVKSKCPDVTLIRAMDMKYLYNLSKYHSLTALVASALEPVHEELFTTEELKVLWKEWKQMQAKAIRKNLLLDRERSKLFAFMEEKGIWYMPLKGVLLKDMYPKMGIRQMADNDILFDENFQMKVCQWFKDQGYYVVKVGKSNHDIYEKKPVYNFEMHTALYGLGEFSEWAEYYKDVKKRLVKDENRNYGYHFTKEDFYVYFVSHAYKHFDISGVGLRQLMDVYVILENWKKELDFSYVRQEMKKLGIDKFAERCRILVEKLFAEKVVYLEGFIDVLSDEERFLLDFFINSGTYGTFEQTVHTRIKKLEKKTGKSGKWNYYLRRIFPNRDFMRQYDPVFGKSIILLPVGWIYRIGKAVCLRPGRIIQEMKIAGKRK